MSIFGKYRSKNNEILEIIHKKSPEQDKILIKCTHPHIDTYGLLIEHGSVIAVFADNFSLDDIGVYIIEIKREPNIKKITWVRLRSFNISETRGNMCRIEEFRKRNDYSREMDEINRYTTNSLYTGKINISNKISQTTRSTPYQELIFTMNDNNVAYTTLSSTNQLTTPVSQNLIIDDPSVLRNDKRTTLFDMAIALKQKDNPQYPLYKNLLIDTNTSIKCFVSLERTAITTITGHTPPYTEIQSERYNKWVYYPNTVVFGLVNLNAHTTKSDNSTKSINPTKDVKIYLMQTYSNIIDPNINLSTLPLLSTKLTLPDGWTYVNVRLNDDTYLTNNSAGEAILVTDDFNNSYQYISKEQAPFLYENLVVIH